jgi:hypothetical protein
MRGFVRASAGLGENTFPSTIRSSLAVRIKKLAGRSRQLIDRRIEMHNHLVLQSRIVVIVTVKVKVIIRKR